MLFSLYTLLNMFLVRAIPPGRYVPSPIPSRSTSAFPAQAILNEAYSAVKYQQSQGEKIDMKQLIMRSPLGTTLMRFKSIADNVSKFKSQNQEAAVRRFAFPVAAFAFSPGSFSSSRP